MFERTEQDRLADLIRDDEKEPVVTGDLLADGLKAQLGNVHPSQIEAIANEIESQGDIVISSVIKTGAGRVIQGNSTIPQRQASSEKILLTLYDVRDDLVDAFGECSFNSYLAKCLTNQINKIASCIVNMGGQAEAFEPLNHVSGLKMPDLVKNAEEVIQRTMQCYKLGTVKEAKIKEDGKEINIVFEGVDGEVKYTASGRIITKGWTGNEAIDYVYTPNSGKMSVKAFEGGRWVNKSNLEKDKENYKISWELTEDDKSDHDSAKTNSVKEEVTQTTQNNESEKDVDGEEDIGSPIS